jgi:site-specific recombinase XerD
MTDTTETTPIVADSLARARVYVESSHAKQTLEAYAADWKHFTTWCDEHKRCSCPHSSGRRSRRSRTP